MSFNGNLEHFPIADVIQLLHMTGKSGILQLKSAKGESHLVFRDGYIVSANHLNNSVRIGKVLVDMGAITEDELNRILVEQKSSGGSGKPLVATLIEKETIDRKTAFKGLETLIELTIVEVLTWTAGTFSLDVSDEYISDEYRYFPEKLQEKIMLDAQGVLMDALRIYDEKMRDGTLSNDFFCDEAPAQPAPETARESLDITADLLGLDALDDLERKIPDVFIGLKDNDPIERHRQVARRTLAESPGDQQDQLITFLSEMSTTPPVPQTPPVKAVILLSQDELLCHAMTAVCKHENLFVFATDEEPGLDMIIEQSLGKDLYPVLIIDVGHDDDPARVIELVRQKTALYPQLTVLPAACGHTWPELGMDALGAGARSIIPRPCRLCRNDSPVPQLITFLTALGPFLKALLPVSQPRIAQHFIASLNHLKTISEPPAIALALLNAAAVQFERAITLVVSKSELIAEKSIGVSSGKTAGPTAPLMFKIPLNDNSLFQEVVEKGCFYYGQRSDTVLTDVLYKEIGAPHSPKILIAPLISRGRVISLTYADFGAKPLSIPQTELLEALVQLAGNVLDNALYRNKIGKTG